MKRHVPTPAEWTSKIRELRLDEAARWLPPVTVFAAVASIGIVTLKIWRTPHFEHVRIVVTLALAAVAVSVMLRTLFLWLTSSQRAWVGAPGAASWVLALEVGILLLMIPVFLLAKGTPEDELTGWTWPLVNKRWLLALYNLSIATFIGPSLKTPEALAFVQSHPGAVSLERIVGRATVNILLSRPQ
jgi:hypothetical protein